MRVKLRLWLVLGVVLGGCVVNPVPTPLSTSNPDKGSTGQTEETPTAGKDAGSNRQFGGDTVTSGVADNDTTSGTDMGGADAAADAMGWDGGMPADATGLAADVTGLAADATGSGDVL